MKPGKGFLIVLVPLILGAAGSTCNADVDLRSSTYLHLYQVDRITGKDLDYAPLYQYLSLDLPGTESSRFSYHFYGWGRLDLGEEADPALPEGYLSSAHVRNRHRRGSGQAMAGRFLVTEGTALEALDGIYVRESFRGFGVTLFGGAPCEDDGAQAGRGDLLTGGRVWIGAAGLFETGFNLLYENGDFEGDERREAGLDLWLRPMKALSLTGRALYNLSSSELASGSWDLGLRLAEDLELTLAGSAYGYDALFQSATNPAFSDTNLDPDDEVATLSISASWAPASKVSFTGSVRAVDHRMDDPGDVTRSEAGLDYLTGGRIENLGLRIADQSGDLPENSCTDLRGFVTFTLGPLDLSLDALVTTYKEAIDGEDSARRIVGSAGWEITPLFRLSADLRLTSSPLYEEDVAGILRLDYGHGVGSGVYQ